MLYLMRAGADRRLLRPKSPGSKGRSSAGRRRKNKKSVRDPSGIGARLLIDIVTSYCPIHVVLLAADARFAWGAAMSGTPK